MAPRGIGRGTARRYALIAAGAWLGARWLAASRRRTSLVGKNALVTGGSRGLGLEIARVLVRKGTHVAIVARDAQELGRAVDLLRAHAAPGVRIIAEPCDLGDRGATLGLLDRVREQLGPVDVLVNDAGVIQVGPLDGMRLEDFDHAMRVHYFAPLELMLAVRDEMRARGGGRIANVTSIGGLVSVPHLMPYSGSKFALVGLSRGMRSELAPDRIFVTTVVPGLMRTGSPRNALFKGNHHAEYAWFKLSDSLPGLSLASGRAARRIVRALEWGEAEVVLGLPARIAARASGLLPEAIGAALELVERALPRGASPRSFRGFESEENDVPPALTVLTERAADRNNER